MRAYSARGQSSENQRKVGKSESPVLNRQAVHQLLLAEPQIQIPPRYQIVPPRQPQSNRLGRAPSLRPELTGLSHDIFAYFLFLSRLPDAPLEVSLNQKVVSYKAKGVVYKKERAGAEYFRHPRAFSAYCPNCVGLSVALVRGGRPPCGEPRPCRRRSADGARPRTAPAVA